MVLDPSGRPIDARFLVAAEWVGLATSVRPKGRGEGFAPGGIAHAVDPIDGRVLCGADGATLETFGMEFDDDPSLFSCSACRARAFLHDGQRL